MYCVKHVSEVQQNEDRYTLSVSAQPQTITRTETRGNSVPPEQIRPPL